MLPRIFVCAVSLLFVLGHCAQAQLPWEQIEAPQAGQDRELAALTVEAIMAKLGVPGVSIAVITGAGLIESRCYGMADVESGAPVTPETRFQAASISKTLCAVAVMQAVERGLFSLDDDVQNLLKSWRLPEYKWSKKHPVTPALLLSHTAGATVHGFPGYAPGAPLPTVQDILNGKGNTGKVEIRSQPGKAFHYAGGGITMLQLLLTETTGRDFPELLEEWVLAPCGMKHSSFAQPPSEEVAALSARAHNLKGARMDAPWHVYPEMAAAGLWTTPTDLCRFAVAAQAALRGDADALLTRDSAERMLTRGPVGPVGLGFFLKGEGEQPAIFEHSGGNWGFQCHFFAHRSAGLGTAIMTNSEGGNKLIGELNARIAQALAWEKLMGDDKKPAASGRR